MKCIFCKNDSSNSNSIEHIVPESLGNKSHILPSKIVCDSCNNYFASKVEKPFLESGAINYLRFDQELVSKRGRIPSMQGIYIPDFPVTFYKLNNNKDYAGILDVPYNAIPHILKQNEGQLFFPTSGNPPEDSVISRFLAKLCIEAIAQRLKDHEGGIEYLVQETQLDPIRNHARYGNPKSWTFKTRRIYDPNRKFIGENGEHLQTVFEFDFLYTELGEWYFIFCLFGLEFTINMGGSSLEGYEDWLIKNNNISPLYRDKS